MNKKNIAVSTLLLIVAISTGCSSLEPGRSSTQGVTDMNKAQSYTRYMLDGDSAMTFKKDYDEAIKQYSLALKEKPRDTTAKNKLAEVEAAKDEFLAKDLEKQIAQYQAKKQAETVVPQVVASDEANSKQPSDEKEVVVENAEPEEDTSDQNTNVPNEIPLSFSDFRWERGSDNSQGWALFNIRMEVTNNSDTIEYVGTDDFITTRGDYAADPFTLSNNPGSERILPGASIDMKVYFSVDSQNVDGFMINYVRSGKLYPLTTIKE